MLHISGHCLIRNEYNSIFSLIKSYEISTYITSWNKYMHIWIMFIDQFYATCELEWSNNFLLLLALTNNEKNLSQPFSLFINFFTPQQVTIQNTRKLNHPRPVPLKKSTVYCNAKINPSQDILLLPIHPPPPPKKVLPSLL